MKSTCSVNRSARKLLRMLSVGDSQRFIFSKCPRYQLTSLMTANLCEVTLTVELCKKRSLGPMRSIKTAGGTTPKKASSKSKVKSNSRQLTATRGPT